LHIFSLTCFFFTLPEDHLHLSPYLSYVSGALAGCAATVGSYPFDLLRTILASQGEPKVNLILSLAFTVAFVTFSLNTFCFFKLGVIHCRSCTSWPEVCSGYELLVVEIGCFSVQFQPFFKSMERHMIVSV
jgi:hypothetical protein